MTQQEKMKTKDKTKSDKRKKRLEKKADNITHRERTKREKTTINNNEHT